MDRHAMSGIGNGVFVKLINTYGTLSTIPSYLLSKYDPYVQSHALIHALTTDYYVKLI